MRQQLRFASARARRACLAAGVGAMLVSACSVKDASDKPADTTTGATTAISTAPPPAPATGASTAAMAGGSSAAVAGTSTGAAASDPSASSGQALRVEVDLKARELRVLRGGQAVETHKVAVGSTKWPTQTGEWTIKQVVFNPEWVPPDESWADEREPKKPGDPDNPLGRFQLVYDPPRTIHGTNKPSSIGQAVSHGSIRMRNEELEQVARQVLEAGGAPKDDAWIQKAKANRTEKQIVDLPRPIPVRVF